MEGFQRKAEAPPLFYVLNKDGQVSISLLYSTNVAIRMGGKDAEMILFSVYHPEGPGSFIQVLRHQPDLPGHLLDQVIPFYQGHIPSLASFYSFFFFVSVKSTAVYRSQRAAKS